MILYHGSSEIVQKPVFGQGKAYNDYGLGFYCTEHMELAKEWACRERKTGFVSGYELDMGNLKILNLSDPEYSILHWLAILLENRRIRLSTPVMKRGFEWLKRYYSVEIDEYDVITGYRADDSYFAFARAFVNNEISLEQLSMAMRLGKLGEQWMVKSRKAFDAVRFQGYTVVPDIVYYGKRKQRDEQARREYQKLLEREEKEGSYIRDLMKKGDMIGYERSI